MGLSHAMTPAYSPLPCRPSSPSYLLAVLTLPSGRAGTHVVGKLVEAGAAVLTGRRQALVHVVLATLAVVSAERTGDVNNENVTSEYTMSMYLFVRVISGSSIV